MKTIIITGASGDIGAEIAKTLDSNENRLILIYNTNKKGVDILSQTLNNECHIYQCNLQHENEIKKVIDDVLAKFKKIDVLINCAGVSLIQQIQDCTSQDYDFIMNNNLKSTILTTAFVSKNMISNQSGNIINISSMWGTVGASMESVYSASKGAINSFTLALAKELGPSNIRVNAICPGLIQTKMNSSLSSETIKDIIDSTPLGRVGTPKDVANLVEFLLSDKSSFITGQIITIDGGFSL